MLLKIICILLHLSYISFCIFLSYYGNYQAYFETVILLQLEICYFNLTYNCFCYSNLNIKILSVLFFLIKFIVSLQVAGAQRELAMRAVFSQNFIVTSILDVPAVAFNRVRSPIFHIYLLGSLLLGSTEPKICCDCNIILS